MSLFANYLSHKFSLTVKAKSYYRGGSCRFPEETKKIITIFNYSNLNTQHKSNRNKKKTTKNYSPETKNSQNNNVTTSEKRHCKLLFISSLNKVSLINVTTTSKTTLKVSHTNPATPCDTNSK